MSSLSEQSRRSFVLRETRPRRRRPRRLPGLARLGPVRRDGARREAGAPGQGLQRVHPAPEPASGTLHLTKLYDWYGSDFLQAAVEAYVATHERSVRVALGAGQRLEVRWLPDDWSLNRRE